MSLKHIEFMDSRRERLFYLFAYNRKHQHSKEKNGRKLIPNKFNVQTNERDGDSENNPYQISSTNKNFSFQFFGRLSKGFKSLVLLSSSHCSVWRTRLHYYIKQILIELYPRNDYQ